MARKATTAKKPRSKKSSAPSSAKADGSKAKVSNLERDALAMHAGPPPGKLSIAALKPITTQRDLSLAYSPGVAFPCLKIAEDENKAYDYTNKGNMVAVISNGTAVLGLGDLGALGAKPVMEGKCVLFKRFADIDAVDIEVDTRDVDEFVNCVRFLGPGFGGINLEDIKAPECFIIEQRLRELMDIPVFHDDQHGTAVIAAAGLLNALEITGRTLKNTTMVVNGAGAAAIACLELFTALGFAKGNITLCDSRGVVYRGREAGMNQWKSAHTVDTKARTLEDAMKGADVFFGVSVAGAVSQKMVKSMGKKPIIFALANPDPEITPEDARAARPDAIIATGRSDYPNQINNVLGFPYIFRGALDVRARAINDEMKVAAARALAALAREDVPDEVAGIYSGRRLQFGPEYLIPTPFDPRLVSAVPPAVAEAAMKSGVARTTITDMNAYRASLSARLDPTVSSLYNIFEEVKANPKRVVFAEGEEEKTIRAAQAFRNAGYGIPILIGRDDIVAQTMEGLGLQGGGLEIHNARLSKRNKHYTDFLYKRLQRHGLLYRDCQRMVNQDRNVFAACMVACGDADAMVTGLTRNSVTCREDILRAIDVDAKRQLFGLSIMVTQGRTVFIADTMINEEPTAEQLADFAIQAAAQARMLGHEPRVALLSYTNFGFIPPGTPPTDVQRAVEILDGAKRDFAYDGEMTASVALDPELASIYPFCRLGGQANVLIMPGLHSASISSRLLQKLGGSTVIGPLLVGLNKSAQIARMDATSSDLVNYAVLAAHDAIKRPK